MTLQELNKLIEGATDGPWLLSDNRTRVLIKDVLKLQQRYICDVSIDEWLAPFYTENNAQFIAAARTALPAALALIAEMKRMAEYYAVPHSMPNEVPWGVNSTDFGKTAQQALTRIAAFEQDVLQQTTGEK